MGTAQFDPKTGGFTGISGTGTGIAGYQPFLNQAASDLNAASAAAAAGQGAGAGALGQAQTAFNAAQAAAASGQDAGAQYMAPGAYQQFMDPYQQDVINASLAQFDRQSGQQARDAGLAAAKGSAYGTERFGVQEGSRQAQSSLDRASMTANMLAQGYQQARQQARSTELSTRTTRSSSTEFRIIPKLSTRTARHGTITTTTCNARYRCPWSVRYTTATTRSSNS